MNSNRITESMRVVVVGTGFVGATSAFAMMVQGIASELVLIDVNKEKCQGEVLDLEHGLSFVPQMRIKAGDWSDCTDADVIVITAGVGQKPGQTRLDLVQTNAPIMREVVQNIKRYTDRAVLVVVSNPLDVMTYVALRESGYPKGRVFGTGTTLDSSRFRFLLGQVLGVAAEDVDAYVLGEHGDSEFPVVSHANVMGEPISNLPGYSLEKVQEIFTHTRGAASEIICKKGATFYAIALVVSHIVRAVLFDEQRTFPVSVLLEGEYGLNDICISVPAVIGRNGVERILSIQLSSQEVEQLQKSAGVIRSVIESLG